MTLLEVPNYQSRAFELGVGLVLGSIARITYNLYWAINQIANESEQVSPCHGYIL